MITIYKQEKTKVLKMYSDFKKILKESEFNKKDKSVVALENQVKNIRKDQFILMVAGEAKSGKSTFINAFLGEEILPMDVKQCTSAIIESKHGTTFSLVATYADERKEKITGAKKIKSFLSKNAALNDEFREIPVTSINNEILIKYKGKIQARVMKDLINGVQQENIYGLSREEYEKKIRAYIRENKDNWADIVTKIVITYKFRDEGLHGVQIIDSPGVNALGRVGNVTDNYIEKANAIMFLKPITGAALESSSFRNFLDSKSVERNENTLFLILTRAANESSENLEKLHKEAIKLYGNIVNEKQIICVDSRIELFIKKISDMSIEEIEECLDDLEKDGDTFFNPPRSLTRNFSKDKYIDYLKSKSNFMAVDQALNLFGRKSHYLALSEFLGRMLKICTKMQDDFEEKIELNKLKVKAPVELAKQIGEIKQKLNEIRVKMGRTTDEIVTKYTGDSGIVAVKAKKGVEEFESSIEAISESDEKAIDKLEKISFKKIDESKEFQEEMQKNIVAECNEALVSLSNEESVKYSSLEPDFTEETFLELQKLAKKDATVKKSYETGRTFKKTHTTSAYSRQKHFSILKPHILEKIKEIQNQATNNLGDFANSITVIYMEELAGNAEVKKEELNVILEEKKNAEEIYESIKKMENIISRIQPLAKVASEIKGGIDSNV